MSTYTICITSEDDWYILEAEEDQAVLTQARTLDEGVLMLRDVLATLKDERDPELRLIIPAGLPVDDARQSGRLTHPVTDEDAPATRVAS
jgi:predicted RNase H-like HicB family nuclease